MRKLQFDAGGAGCKLHAIFGSSEPGAPAAALIVGTLAMTRIFRKTDKGVDEIATRANRLVPRLRTALILVDGTRDEGELATLIKEHARETLEELLTLGYVEVASVAEAPPKKAAQEPAPKKTATEPASGEKSFASFRAEAVRAFNDLTGPAGESLAMKMEKATSREQLAPLLQTAYQIIGTSRGSQAATEFKARFASF
ncbi:MAG TPA: hypothetical protein VFU71_01820 [Burkholderiaceae bacterium]|nr:hypothetical protein [Burkholderiaceae bacterium]